MGGFGDGVLDALNRAGIHVPLLKIALAEGFVHHGAVDDLRRQQRIDADGIYAQIREALDLPEARPSPGPATSAPPDLGADGRAARAHAPWRAVPRP